MKTYTITTNTGREIAKNILADKLFMAIPAGFKPAGASKLHPMPNNLFKRKVGPDQFETIIIIEDKIEVKP